MPNKTYIILQQIEHSHLSQMQWLCEFIFGTTNFFVCNVRSFRFVIVRVVKKRQQSKQTKQSIHNIHKTKKTKQTTKTKIT